MSRKLRVVVCGAGIVGVSSAYYLSRLADAEVILIDERGPLQLTSANSTECFRNWWPDRTLQALIDRSINLATEVVSANRQHPSMNRRGYLYTTANEKRLPEFLASTAHIAALGAMPLRLHHGSTDQYAAAQPSLADRNPGADLLLGAETIQRHYPHLSSNIIAAIHVRKAGWLDAQHFGVLMLQGAKQLGARLMNDRVHGLSYLPGGSIRVDLRAANVIECDAFVNAAGPMAAEVADMMQAQLALRAELHLKAVIEDTLGVIPRNSPLLISLDKLHLNWNPEEEAALIHDPHTRWLTEQMPAGAHARPEGSATSRKLILLWDYKTNCCTTNFPIPLDDMYPELALRALAKMVPGLGAYVGRTGKPILDGGYYMRTADGLPAVGPLGHRGGYVATGVAGYGIMSACAIGELIAKHIAGQQLPAYAARLLPARLADPKYLQHLQPASFQGEL